jgi:hypothetical protein|tara:strand:- start:472 stop:1287 length:816 start_codon:yes stop_codon:yes gene_type:complete
MAILATGNSFADNDQVTAAKLNAAVNSATFVAGNGGSTDNTTLEVSSNAIRIKDDGVTQAKTSFITHDTGAMTITGSAPSITLDDTDNSGTSPVISSDSADGDLTITAGKADAEVIIATANNDASAIPTRVQVGEEVSKDNGGNTVHGVKVTGSIYATVDIVADGDVVADLDSDERLKDNITPIVDAIDKVNQLSGNTFTWNEESRKSGDDIGVIAQEVQKVFPMAVREREGGYLKVDYIRLVPVLLEAIKELNQKIEVLESKSHTHGIKK